MSDGYDYIGLDLSFTKDGTIFSTAPVNSFQSVNSTYSFNTINFGPTFIDGYQFIKDFVGAGPWYSTASATSLYPPITTQSQPVIQTLDFDLTPIDNANFKLTITLYDNKINSANITEFIKSFCFKDRKLQTYVCSGKMNALGDFEWHLYDENWFTDLAKNLIKEANEIIMRVKNMEIFC